MTNDDKELVERLRHCSENCGDDYLHELSGRSAHRIEALSAKVGQARMDEREKIIAWLRTVNHYVAKSLAQRIEAGEHHD